MEQCLERAISKGYNVNLEALTTLVPSRRIEPRVEGVKRNLRRHISGAENVTSLAQRMSRQLLKRMSRQLLKRMSHQLLKEMPRHQGATWMLGRGSSLFAENKHQLKTGGLVYRPVPER